MEFGPRALGSRSIIGDARSQAMQSTMNLKIKFRESFRPFAPSILKERVHEYFEMRPQEDSPYMLIVAPVLDSQRIPRNEHTAERRGIDKLKVARSSIPAVTHVDYSVRVQTVDPERHGRYYDLMKAVRTQDRLPGHHQHEFQRERRAPSSAVPQKPTSASWRRTWTRWCSSGSCC